MLYISRVQNNVITDSGKGNRSDRIMAGQKRFLTAQHVTSRETLSRMKTKVDNWFKMILHATLYFITLIFSAG